MEAVPWNLDWDEFRRRVAAGEVPPIVTIDSISEHPDGTVTLNDLKTARTAATRGHTRGKPLELMPHQFGWLAAILNPPPPQPYVYGDRNSRIDPRLASLLCDCEGTRRVDVAGFVARADELVPFEEF